MLGGTGEQLVQARDFYPLFQVTQEWRLVLGSKPLGSIPLSKSGCHGQSGALRRAPMENRRRRREGPRHRSGAAPGRAGSPLRDLLGEEVHTRLIDEMRTVYESKDVPPFLDATAQELLAQGRDAYRRAGLARQNILNIGRSVLLFPWVGTSTVAAMCVALAGIGVKSEDNGLGITVSGRSDDVMDALAKLASLTSDHLGAVENGNRCALHGEVRRVRARDTGCAVSGPAVTQRQLKKYRRLQASCLTPAGRG